MNVAYGSSMTGDISWFGGKLRQRDVSVSFTVDDGFNFLDSADFRVFHQVEPPEVLNVTEKLIQNHKFYDLIMTWNERVLAECPNAQFLPEAPCSWLPRGKAENSVYPQPDVNSKMFAASFLTSDKTFCPGHKLRVDIYHALKPTYGNLQILKHMSPPRWDDKRTIIEPYQYHVAVENAMHNNWFADKIVDAFIGKAIPLYWGCPNLDTYFNMDGVIRFDSVSDLEVRLAGLTPEYYAAHISAVEDNFNRALKYVHTWDRIEEAITAGIARKNALGLQHEDAQDTLVTPRRRLRLNRPIKNA